MQNQSQQDAPLSFSSPLVVFDFDHTLTDRETLSRFLFFYLPPLRVVRALCILPLLLPSFWIRYGWREGLKRGVLRAFLKGLPAKDFVQRANRYAQEALPGFLKSDMKRRLRKYLEAGQEVWLISGSLSAYLMPLAQSLGVRVVLACDLAVNQHGKLTGTLRGENCWGPEKLQRLRMQQPLADRPLIMYGDSGGDRDLLAIAWEGHLVRG